MVTALNRAVLKRALRTLDICLGMQLFTCSRDVGELFEYIHEEQSFYFPHSYHVLCEDRGDVVATTPYGGEFVMVKGYLERKINHWDRGIKSAYREGLNSLFSAVKLLVRVYSPVECMTVMPY